MIAHLCTLVALACLVVRVRQLQESLRKLEGKVARLTLALADDHALAERRQGITEKRLRALESWHARVTGVYHA